MTTAPTAPSARRLTPEPIHRILLAYCGSKALMSAVEIDLFSLLADHGPLTEPEIRAELRLHPRFAGHFLDTLVALELLTRDGDQYANSEVADLFLDRRKPTNIGGFAETTSDTFYPAWGQLTKALRTGQAQAPLPPDDDQHLFRTNATQDPDRVRRFMSAMDSHSTRMGEQLARLLPWHDMQTFADVGGARGNLASVIATAHPHLKGICFDRPQSRPFFDEHVRSLGLSERVEFRSGDFFADPLPEVDVIVLGHVLHDWGPDNRRLLIANAFRSLRPGGALVIYDRMIDNSPRDISRLFYSLTFMLASAGGSEYSVAQCSSWLVEAGFGTPTATPVLDDHTVVVARR